MHELATLGFGPFFAKQLEGGDGDELIPARIASAYRGGYQVWSEVGEGTACLPPHLLRELRIEGLPGVGDWVTLESPPAAEATAIIKRVLDRRTVFTRGAAGRGTYEQVVAANVDLVFCVCGLDADYNVRRIERYLARIWASGAVPVVVLNKADICEDAAECVLEVEEHCPGVDVYLISALQQEGLAEVRALIQFGQTAAVVGSSGAGKSTLVNALLGEDKMATGAVRARDGRGCHVTSHRQIVLLPDGGLLLDTPGMRELQLPDDEGISEVFTDVAEFAGQCHFKDCAHESEPGCAVKAAVAAGELPVERVAHYLKLGKEAQSFELRQNEHERRKSERVLSVRIRKWKGQGND